MDKAQYEKLKIDTVIKTFVQEEQFGQWLRKFFYLNAELNKEYDTIYQDAFYIVFYELVTVGLDYSINVLSAVEKSNNKEKIEFYTELIKGLSELKTKFTKTEFQFIEYKRHNSSHIFQNHYENRISNNKKFISKRKGRQIDDINKELKSIILKYGNDKNFDNYLTKKLYLNTSELYQRLVEIKTHYNK